MHFDAWRQYQADVRKIVQEQWQERQLLLVWLGLVEATHRDADTMAYLTRCIRLGRWSGKLIGTARRIADSVHAEAMAS